MRQPTSQDSLTAVIVEPDGALARFLQAALTDDGWRAVISPTPDASRQLIRREAPALVIIGLELASSKAAWTLLNSLRMEPQTAWLPILFITPDAQLAREQGPLLRSEGYALLETPFDVDEFLALARAQADAGRQPPLEDSERTPLA
jgi:DNA-binding response OmpR family regulator